MSVETFVQMLTSLAGLLDKAQQFAEAKKIEPSVLVNARLAPDMFPFSLQIGVACVQAKLGTALLCGWDAPQYEPPPATLPELKAYIEAAVAFVKTATPADFEGAEERAIVFPIPVDNLELACNGGEFLRDWVLPHFYFHITTAYDILRHNGIELSKQDYLGRGRQFIRQRQ